MNSEAKVAAPHRSSQPYQVVEVAPRISPRPITNNLELAAAGTNDNGAAGGGGGGGGGVSRNGASALPSEAARHLHITTHASGANAAGPIATANGVTAIGIGAGGAALGGGATAGGPAPGGEVPTSPKSTNSNRGTENDKQVASATSLLQHFLVISTITNLVFYAILLYFITAANSGITQLYDKQIPLTRHRGAVATYDAVLTLSSRLAAETGDPSWAIQWNAGYVGVIDEFNQLTELAPSAADAFNAAVGDTVNYAIGTEAEVIAIVSNTTLPPNIRNLTALVEKLTGPTFVAARQQIYVGLEVLDQHIAGVIDEQKVAQNNLLIGLGVVFGCLLILVCVTIYLNRVVSKRLAADLTDLAAGLDRSLQKEYEYVLAERGQIEHSIGNGDAMVSAFRSRNLYHEAKNLWFRLQGQLSFEVEKLTKLHATLVRNHLREQAGKIQRSLLKIQKLESTVLQLTDEKPATIESEWKVFTATWEREKTPQLQSILNDISMLFGRAMNSGGHAAAYAKNVMGPASARRSVLALGPLLTEEKSTAATTTTTQPGATSATAVDTPAAAAASATLTVAGSGAPHAPIKSGSSGSLLPPSSDEKNGGAVTITVSSSHGKDSVPPLSAAITNSQLSQPHNSVLFVRCMLLEAAPHLSLKYLLISKHRGIELPFYAEFVNFLRSEVSEENLNFFLAVEQYRELCRLIHLTTAQREAGRDGTHTPTPKSRDAMKERMLKIADLALRIYKTFIASSALTMVNIDSGARKKLDDQLGQAAAITTPTNAQRTDGKAKHTGYDAAAAAATVAAAAADASSIVSPHMAIRRAANLSSLERWTHTSTAPVDEHGNLIATAVPAGTAPLPGIPTDGSSSPILRGVGLVTFPAAAAAVATGAPVVADVASSPSTPKSHSIAAKAYERIMNSIRVDEKLFDDAQLNVFRLMSSDSFVRFRQSKLVTEQKQSLAQLEEKQAGLLIPLKRFNKATDAAVHAYCERAASAGHFDLASTLWEEGLTLFTRHNGIAIRLPPAARAFIGSMESELRRLRGGTHTAAEFKKETDSCIKRMLQQKQVWCAEFFTEQSLTAAPATAANPAPISTSTAAVVGHVIGGRPGSADLRLKDQKASAVASVVGAAGANMEVLNLLRLSAVRRLESLIVNARKARQNHIEDRDGSNETGNDRSANSGSRGANKNSKSDPAGGGASTVTTGGDTKKPHAAHDQQQPAAGVIHAPHPGSSPTTGSGVTPASLGGIGIGGMHRHKMTSDFGEAAGVLAGGGGGATAPLLPRPLKLHNRPAAAGMVTSTVAGPSPPAALMAALTTPGSAPLPRRPSASTPVTNTSLAASGAGASPIPSTSTPPPPEPNKSPLLDRATSVKASPRGTVAAAPGAGLAPAIQLSSSQPLSLAALSGGSPPPPAAVDK